MSEDVEIKFYDGINCTPAAHLAVAGWLECEARGWGSGDLNMHHGHKAFVAVVKDGHEQRAVGVITWGHVEELKCLWVYQAYVEEEFRGRGVFTEMLNFLIAKSMELKVPKIQLATHVNNKFAREVYRKTGFAEQAVTLTLEVPQA